MNELAKLAIYLVVGASLFCVVFFLFQIDWVVNEVLYDYGLVFSQNWAAVYWTAIRISLGLLAFSIVAISLLGFVSYWKTKEETIRTVVLCKSCGKALARLNRNFETKQPTPKFQITTTCPLCNDKLIEK